MTREMNTVHDYRWDAARTVARKSELALLRLRNAQTLARLNERELTHGEPPRSDDGLIIETEWALDMARAALDDSADEDEKE